jgi:hypothetical protein
MSDHRVVIMRNPDPFLRWEIIIDNSTVDFACSHWGAIRVAKRALRAMDMEPEVYLVRTEGGGES